MIQIGRIREGFSWFKGLHTESIQDLLTNIDNIIDQIPEDERWNSYYTLAHHKEGNRITKTFIKQDVIAFDIDQMQIDNYESYIPIVCDALNIDVNKTGIVNSGNGLHFLILVDEITDVNYFKKYKKAYKNTCTIINDALKAANLEGKADDVVFEPTRVFRLPNTKNIKQKNNQQIVKKAFIVNANMEKQSLELLEPDTITENEVLTDGEYGKPDQQYILNQCNFLKWIEDNPEEVHEPEWYAMLSITAHFEDDNETSRRLTEALDTPSINKSNKEAKIDQARDRSGPRKCSSISQLPNWGGCRACPHFGKVSSPICLKGPNYIATESLGFTLKIGNKIIRQYPDLLKFYNKQHSHKSIGSIGSIYVFDKTHYRATNKAEVRNFALEHFVPLAKATERSEFYSFVEDSNITSESFMNNKNNEGLINFKNGVLDIESGELLEHDPEYGFFYCLPFDYDPDAKCPTWDNYVSTITLGRECLQDVLHEYMGYIVRGSDYIFQNALILSGTGKNGKSTFIQIMRELVGSSNTSNTSITALATDKFMVSNLHGKLVNFSEEEPPNCFKETGIFKHITGGTEITAQFKYGQPFEMINKAKIIITYNEMPYLSDTSTGMKRRLLVVPFEYDLEKEHASKVDIHLKSKLNGELSGIFNKALEGWKRLEVNKKFTRSKFIDEQLTELVNNSDPIAAFITEECTVGNEKEFTTVAALYKSYSDFHLQNYNTKPVTKRNFGNKIKQKGFNLSTKRIENKTARCIDSITLNTKRKSNPEQNRF